jgi:tetratricopeptide (TPR) repeat protein
MRIHRTAISNVASLLLVLCLTPQVTWAIQVTNKEELKLLPDFCKGTQLIREVSGDPTPFTHYGQIYGADFQHLHHYCWALNTENKYRRNPNQLYFGFLDEAIGDLDYVLTQSKDPNFFIIPDAHLAKARIYLLQKQKGKAVTSALEAIAKKPDFVRAYTFISDLYEDMGQKANAIKTLESGLKKVPDSKPMLRRLTRLGGTPPKPDTQDQPSASVPASPSPTDAAPPQETSTSAATSAPTTTQSIADAPELPPAAAPEPQDAPAAVTQDPDNPHCRFCP